MVNLLPEEMKKGLEEDKGFDAKNQEEDSKEMKDIKMTTAFKDKPFKKERKPGFFLQNLGILFLKRRKNKKR